MDKKNVYLKIIAFVLIFFTSSFTYSQEGITPQTPAVVEKEAVIEELEQQYVKPGYVTVNFKGADIKAVLNYLSEVGGVDIVPSPEVTGSVDLKLTDKPWEVALDIIVKNYGYAYEREGDIIRVVTLDSLKQAELTTEVIHLNYTTAEEAEAAVKDMLTERGKITYDSRTNTLLVTDLPTNTYRIKQVMAKIDRRTPQVMIEARIIETLLEKDEKMGIDWTIKIAAIGARRPTTIPFTNWGNLPGFYNNLGKFFPFGQTSATSGAVSPGGSDAITTTGTADFPTEHGGNSAFPYVDTDQFTYGTLDFTQFQAVLELLKQRRRTEIVSNPRITTLNHKEAKILVGRVYNFPTFDQTEMTGQWVISGYDQKELGIRLLVTPHVNARNEIVVELKPEISNYLGQEKITEELSAPLWSTREADTQVMVKDGDTIFIGGLISENNIDVEKKVPLLGDLFGDLPVIGGLVKHKGQDTEKKELIFFITVHIVNDTRTLTRIVTRGITETIVPPEYLDETDGEVPGDTTEVYVEMPMAVQAPAPKKAHKPFFDFRKEK